MPKEAQAGLDMFLQNSDAAFAAISSSAGALSDEQIDRLVDGKVTEKELLADEQINALSARLGGDEAVDLMAKPINGTEGKKI